MVSCSSYKVPHCRGHSSPKTLELYSLRAEQYQISWLQLTVALKYACHFFFFGLRNIILWPSPLLMIKLFLLKHHIFHNPTVINQRMRIVLIYKWLIFFCKFRLFRSGFMCCRTFSDIIESSIEKHYQPLLSLCAYAFEWICVSVPMHMCVHASVCFFTYNWDNTFW